MRNMGRLGLLVSLLAVILGLIITPSPAAARSISTLGTDDVLLVGQVLTVDSTAGIPTNFVLETKTRIINFRIGARATFTARSAEAEVEGFTEGDYAIVKARHAGHTWLALRITFDVQPLHVPDKRAMTATVIRERMSPRQLVVRLPSAQTRRVSLDSQTAFQVNSVPTSTPPIFVRGALVHLTVQSTTRGWIALDVDLLIGISQPR